MILPFIKPVIGATLITSVLSSFQQFTIIYNMTDGGSIDATTTLSIATYKQAFTGDDLGAGSALAVIAALPIVLVFIAFQRFLVSGMTAGAVKE